MATFISTREIGDKYAFYNCITKNFQYPVEKKIIGIYQKKHKHNGWEEEVNLKGVGLL